MVADGQKGEPRVVCEPVWYMTGRNVCITGNCKPRNDIEDSERESDETVGGHGRMHSQVRPGVNSAS